MSSTSPLQARFSKFNKTGSRSRIACASSCRDVGKSSVTISEEVFYRVQAVLAGRIQPMAPRHRNRKEFPLRGFIHCSVCGRGLTGSWSKGRHGRYAYYHCRPKCRAVNITKARLEGLFVNELERLQRTPGYMRLLKESVLQMWHERQSAVRGELEDVERKVEGFSRSSTGSMMLSSSHARSTSSRTSGTVIGCARN
jgi:hypothetical protein